MRTRIAVKYAAGTDVGLVCQHNEDAYLASGPVFLVADGMGGHKAGDVAAATALAAFSELTQDHLVEPSQLQKAVKRAARAVNGLPGVPAPGSTLTGLVLSENGAMPCVRVLNIGDSRTYYQGKHGFEQITKDHSQVQEQIDAGLISAEQAQHLPGRNVITRALGAGCGPRVRADYFVLPARVGDRYIICSDGLSSMVTDTLIEATAAVVSEPEGVVDALVKAARNAGGRDNISVIVVDIAAAYPPWEDDDLTHQSLPGTQDWDYDPDAPTLDRSLPWRGGNEVASEQWSWMFKDNE